MGKKRMDISLIYEDGSENEIEITLCCIDCAYLKYGWNKRIFDRIFSAASKHQPITVPSHIRNNQDFILFMKNS